MATRTECGRCQSQCPAWATGKPLSPKRSSSTCATTRSPRPPCCWPSRMRSGPSCRTWPGPRRTGRWSAPGTTVGVIDPDVIWSCTNCGACVEECPVDIEHIDHIDGMRRHQVLIESAFPVEATCMLRNLENKGDPWGMGQARRADWITELDFEMPVVDGTIEPDMEYLFWVGCAGALEDRAKKTTEAIATLLHQAGVKFAVLGPAAAPGWLRPGDRGPPRRLHHRRLPQGRPGPAEPGHHLAGRVWSLGQHRRRAVQPDPGADITDPRPVPPTRLGRADARAGPPGPVVGRGRRHPRRDRPPARSVPAPDHRPDRQSRASVPPGRAARHRPARITVSAASRPASPQPSDRAASAAMRPISPDFSARARR